MQFSANEWIKSGRSPVSLRPDYIVLERDKLLPARSLGTGGNAASQHEISSAELAGRPTSSLEPNYGLPLFSCLAIVRCREIPVGSA